MKIQSAGRLGNQLYIFCHALNLRINSQAKSVSIFADRYHSKVNEELLDTFSLMSGNGVKLEVKNNLGLILKFVDKLNVHSPQLSRFLRRVLRIETEGMDKFTENAWIQRGFFQNDDYPENVMVRMNSILVDIIDIHVSYSRLTQRLPFLESDYQAIHVRRTDFFSTEIGVIDPISQLAGLRDGLSVVICTDATREEILSILQGENFEILTPNESTSWETLAILSRAENLVMTNSTLSFWAGLIASKAGKTVWAPNIWNRKGLEPRKLPFSQYKTYSPRFEGL
jgi:hypothetical protein